MKRTLVTVSILLFSIPALATSVKFTSNFNNNFTNFSAQKSLPVHIQVQVASAEI